MKDDGPIFQQDDVTDGTGHASFPFDAVRFFIEISKSIGLNQLSYRMAILGWYITPGLRMPLQARVPDKCTRSECSLKQSCLWTLI